MLRFAQGCFVLHLEDLSNIFAFRSSFTNLTFAKSLARIYSNRGSQIVEALNWLVFVSGLCRQPAVQRPSYCCDINANRMVPVLSLRRLLYECHSRALVFQHASVDLQLCASAVLERGFPTLLDNPATTELYHSSAASRAAPGLLDVLLTPRTLSPSPHLIGPNIKRRTAYCNTIFFAISLAIDCPSRYPRPRPYPHASLLRPYTDRSSACRVDAFRLLGSRVAAR